jgi:hydrogenase-4 component B
MSFARTALWLMVLTFGAGAVLSTADVPGRVTRLITGIAAALGGAFALAAAAAVLVTGQPVVAVFPHILAPAGGMAIYLDRLGAVFLALAGGVSVPAAIYGVSYTASYEGRYSLRLFGFMFNSFLGTMSLVPCAGNIVSFLLVWEGMAITSYFLVMTESDNTDTREAGHWYIAMTHAGFVLLLPMFALLAGPTGATTFAALRAAAAALSPAVRSGVFVLALLAFGSKAGVVPLHVWLPRAHPAAPSHVSALMSGVMIKLGIYGLLRVALDLLGPGPAWWGGVVLVAGSLSALGGVLYALTENDLKRLLAYSSVENIGIVLLGIGAGLVLDSYRLHTLALVGFSAAAFHTINHGLFKSALFLASGNVVHVTHTRNMEHMGGLVKRMPFTSISFLIGAMAAAALPPLNGFASEWMVFQALLSGVQIPQAEVAIGTPLAVGVLALTSGLAAVCFVKAFGIGFLAMARSDRAAAACEPHWSRNVVAGALAAGCVLFGLFAPHVVSGLGLTLAQATGTGGQPPTAGPLWLPAPSGAARVAPLVIGILVLSTAAVAFLAVRGRGLMVRRADTWGCGRIVQTPRMEYTSSAFAEPLRRIFSELYRPTEHLSVSVHPEARHFVRSITYTTRIAPWIETALYAGVTRTARAAATRVRRIQAGSVHIYLLYVAAALVVALASAWWFE